MKPRDLLERARRMAAGREMTRPGFDLATVDPATVPPHLMREFLRRNLCIEYVAPDGTVTDRVRPDWPELNAPDTSTHG